jgi:tryptophan-rich sensory protein
MRLVFLALFMIVVVGVGFAIGLTVRPGEWYQSLAKPFFTPPPWVFGPVWTLVYLLIAVAGWRVALTEGFRSKPFSLWGAQMFLNWLWTPVFFGAHLIAPGLATILALLFVVLMFMIVVTDRVAFWCFGVYLIWLSYASVLNASILVLNQP